MQNPSGHFDLKTIVRHDCFYISSVVLILKSLFGRLPKCCRLMQVCLSINCRNPCVSSHWHSLLSRGSCHTKWSHESVFSLWWWPRNNHVWKGEFPRCPLLSVFGVAKKIRWPPHAISEHWKHLQPDPRAGHALRDWMCHLIPHFVSHYPAVVMLTPV